MRIYLFELFGIQVKSYGLMIAIGIMVALLMLLKLSNKFGYDEDDIWGLFFQSVIVGLLGGKLLWIITEIDYIIDNPKILLDVGTGFVVYGALIAGMLSIYLYCRKKKWNFLNILDITVPGVAIAQGFGRVGCFLAGCCYGAPTHSHYGVVFPTNSLAPSDVRLYPTQVYSSIFDFILGFILLWYLKKKNKDGKVAGLYLILYSVGRFIIEFLRNDPRGSVGVLSTSQFIAIFTFIFGIMIFNIHSFRKNKGIDKK